MTTAASEAPETLSEPIKIRFDREVLAALEKEAADEDRPLNYIVRRHLRASVKGKPTKRR